MERQEDRLEEIARNYMTMGRTLTFHQYSDMIDSVTSDQINAAAERAMSGAPTMTVLGDSINLVPNVTDVARQLN